MTNRDNEDELIYYGAELKEMWIAVLRLAVIDYHHGVQRGFHRWFLQEEPIEYPDRYVEIAYKTWLASASWLTSDETDPGSCIWLLRLLGMDQDIDLLPRLRSAHTTENTYRGRRCASQ